MSSDKCHCQKCRTVGRVCNLGLMTIKGLDQTFQTLLAVRIYDTIAYRSFRNLTHNNIQIVIAPVGSRIPEHICHIATGLAGGRGFHGNVNRGVITVPFLSAAMAMRRTE